jgi:hypothetical protein
MARGKERSGGDELARLRRRSPAADAQRRMRTGRDELDR